jgi:DNA-binding NarL/FixJ family response regulator
MKIINHAWKCKKCGKWIGEDYDECSFCKVEGLKKKDKINLKKLIIGNWDLLTKERKRIFKMKFKGKRNNEIAKILGVSRQAIHCAIKRSIEKINLKKWKKHT